MKNVYCQEVIISNLLKRGKGVVGNPVREVTQVFDKEGNLIAENDPMLGTFTEEQMIEFTNWCIDNDVLYADQSNFIKWQESKLPF